MESVIASKWDYTYEGHDYSIDVKRSGGIWGYVVTGDKGIVCTDFGFPSGRAALGGALYYMELDRTLVETE